MAARTFNLRVHADYLFVMFVPFVESAVSRYATTARQVPLTGFTEELRVFADDAVQERAKKSEDWIRT